MDMHEDDSDVTLNVCLGKSFTAATLSFCGMACATEHRKLQHTYAHQKGRAVIHLGSHRHGADNIETGERVNFILWSTSESFRSSDVYHKKRMRSLSAVPPDPICLSYTHDKDYTQHLQAPSQEEALRRGVMLDHVARRDKISQRPVHDLATPVAEINECPSVCLFLEGLPAPIVREFFDAFMRLSIEVRITSVGTATDAVPYFFVAVQAEGAVPQVRSICGVEGSPALAILDIDKSLRYRCRQPVTTSQLHEFVSAYLDGKLVGSAEALEASDSQGAEESLHEKEDESYQGQGEEHLQPEGIEPESTQSDVPGDAEGAAASKRLKKNKDNPSMTDTSCSQGKAQCGLL